ncbi:hypothetical protein [Qipengyuania vesicularis]|uniref:hypothetical protein n=1 Tax=Qipengyuania vesicularis TaxID=2867232 RepID=UPI001C87E98D|nr:hypothetical protein [Qipengyuania vesicularis]MBX7527549.1 hypothetical protein [Qipengyuania vesicularis]
MSARKTPAQGRPLVFLAMIAFGWIGIRAIALSLPDVPAAFTPDNDNSPVLSEAAPAPAPQTEGDGQAAGVAAPRVTDGLVEGLSEVPPAHMSQEIDTAQSLAGHNSLWMAASGADLLLDDPIEQAGSEAFQPSESVSLAE